MNERLKYLFRVTARVREHGSEPGATGRLGEELRAVAEWA